MSLNFIEHEYDYTSQFVSERERDAHDRNLPVYKAINRLGEQVGQKITITHFISKHSRSPKDLYEDIEVRDSPLPIRSRLDEVLKARFLTPLSVNDNKGLVDKEAIERDLYALSR